MTIDAEDRLAVPPSVLRDLDLAPGDAGPRALAHALSEAAGDVPEAELDAAAAEADAGLAEDGVLLLTAPGSPPAATLAAWRDRLWPRFHAVAYYRVGPDGTRRRSLSGSAALEGGAEAPLTVLACRRRRHVLSPDATVEKFDQNAEGWNGAPASPGYGHFRWMRRYVGRFARPAAGDRVLDFGCGAGWCGIEAVEGVRDVELCAFDPSPEMVRMARENARAAGVERFEARTGFGSDPPFPAEGEPRFQLVISSGVISFAPDFDAFLDGLARALAPGATLVIGDINAGSRGFRRRRASKPLLPVRELNAATAAAVRQALEARGFVHAETAGYQLTYPVPEAMHLSETRLKGALSLPLLLANRVMAGIDRALHDPLASQFDSWVMRLEAPRFLGVTTGTPQSRYVYDEDGTRRPRPTGR